MYDLSLASICIEPTVDAKIVSTATGCLIKRDNSYYLVTAWHCLTGCNPYTLNPINREAPIKPDSVQLSIPILIRDNGGQEGIAIRTFSVPLYDHLERPIWLIHSSDAVGADLAVLPIPIPFIMSDDQHIITPETGNAPDMILEAGVEVTINGFMFGNEIFPIWKRGTIASEPLLVDQKKDQFYSVDSSTRQGLSGSPVFCIAHGSYTSTRGSNVIVGRTDRRPNLNHRFIGIYSGRRMFRDQEEAQIGMVWPSSLIDEIIKSGVKELPSLDWKRKPFPKQNI